MSNGTIKKIKLPDGNTYDIAATETDPVFSASAAAGITSTDISNWDTKADIYDITSGVGTARNGSALDIVLSDNKAEYKYSRFMVFIYQQLVINGTTQVRDTNNGSFIEISRSRLTINGTTSPTLIQPGLYYGTLSAWNNNATMTLTSAPTMSDIPTVPTNVSAFTNDAGYLASYTETDPVFTASAAYGISSSDITNWNSKTSNTGTVTSVGLTNDTNGGLSISGSPVTTSGSITIGHSNVLTSAQTTSAVYPIKIDKNGHISEYGTAVTSMPASDVSAWAKEATKPSYTYSEVGAAPSSHTHGNITSGGDITATAPTIANGDQIVINDSSESKITNGPTFDGTTTNKYLSPKGTWESLPQGTAYTAGTGLSLSGTEFNHSNSVTAQTTQAVYPIKIDAQGHISDYGSAVTIPVLPANIVNTITTTAGAHTAITSSTGDVSFKVPTKTSHLDNDSGFITSYTDEKLKTTTTSNNGTYYFIFGNASSTAETKYYSTDIRYSKATSTDSIQIGQVSSSSTKKGRLTLTSGAYYIYLDPPAYSDISANKTYTLPTSGGTIALTSDIPDISGKIDTAGTGLSKSGTTLNHTNSVTAQTTQAVYPIKIDAQGHISAYGSAVTVPTTPSDIGAATSDHVHGNITNGGDITATAPTIANGDQLIINDNSASKITNGPTFDGSTTTKALTPKGTWETFATSNTDTKVTQAPAPSSSDAGTEYRLLVSKSANDTSETTSVLKTSRIYINPSKADIGLYTSGSEDLDTAIAALNWDVSWSSS